MGATGTSWPVPLVAEPVMAETMEAAMQDGEVEATDGCFVEPDGVCEHGYPSWLVYWGVI